MSVVVSFEGYRPSPRYDATAWTAARIYEGAAAAGPWTLLETIALSPVDLDPSNPAARNFTTELGTAAEQWYYLEFIDATGDTLEPTVPVQNVSDASPYATVDELARILKIRQPTADQTAALTRVLMAAAGEINAEIDLAADAELSSAWQLALAEEVNLERAVEHWRQQETPFGLMVVGVDMPAERTGRDSWDRHAVKLAPIKGQWGFA